MPILSRVGEIYELRLMVDFSGSNRGYCFVVYSNPQEAKRACQELNNLEIAPGKHIGVVMSVDNRRLFVGGIPRDRSREEVRVSVLFFIVVVTLSFTSLMHQVTFFFRKKWKS